MALSNPELELLRDAIQDLLFFGSPNRENRTDAERPTSVSEAWRTIEQHTTEPISIPGEDAEFWTFRFKELAWKAYCATVDGGSLPAGVNEQLRDIQDKLRVLQKPETQKPARNAGEAWVEFYETWTDEEKAEHHERMETLKAESEELTRRIMLSVQEVERMMQPPKIPFELLRGPTLVDRIADKVADRLRETDESTETPLESLVNEPQEAKPKSRRGRPLEELTEAERMALSLRQQTPEASRKDILAMVQKDHSKFTKAELDKLFEREDRRKRRQREDKAT